jgi:hypothetical protein
VKIKVPIVEHPDTKQVELGPAIHLAFEQLEPVYLEIFVYSKLRRQT